MKRFIFILSILFVGKELHSQGIQFVQGMTSWNEVLERSKTEKKPIFVDIYTEWCGPCKWMDQNVFNQQEVGTYMNQHFINIKLDAEKGWGPGFKSTFGVAAYPTYLFFDPEGNMVFNTGGSKPAEKFLSLSQRAIDNWKSGISSKKLQDLLNNEKDLQSIKSVLGKLGGNDIRTSYLLDIYLDLLSEEALHSKETMDLIRLNLNAPISANSKAVQILIKDYQTKPIHSSMILSSWNRLSILIGTTVDSAAVQNNYDLYLSMQNLLATMYDTDQMFVNLFKSYHQARYYARSQNQADFVKSMESYIDDFFLWNDIEKWIEMDNKDFVRGLHVEYGIADPDRLPAAQKDSAAKSHYSLIRVSDNHLKWLVILFKEVFPEMFKQYDKTKIDLALQQSNERYENNQVFVLPGVIAANLKFIADYKK